MIYVGIFDVSCVCNVYMSISSISVNFWELFDLLSNTDVYLQSWTMKDKEMIQNSVKPVKT